LAEQGIQIPFSAESRDISRLTRRLLAAASVVVAAAFGIRKMRRKGPETGSSALRLHVIPAQAEVALISERPRCDRTGDLPEGANGKGKAFTAGGIMGLPRSGKIGRLRGRSRKRESCGGVKR
jgi:hypothetical protein